MIKNINLDFVLPKENYKGDIDCKEKEILVVIYLYYEATIADYIDYIKNIPQDVRVLIVTSNEKAAVCVREHLKGVREDYQLFMKENRGRDISALLIACRQEILKADYICFVHDKNISRNYTEDDVAHFIECMWENTLGSETYIYNVIDLLEREANIGVLLTPEPLSTNLSCFIENTWYGDFDVTCQLVKRLGLDCDLKEDEKPISVGTAFWAKTEALKKLFEVDWQYEDFDEEPLPNDGTISHAIERSFAYVAQDAGFDTGIVMTNQFAERRIAYLQNKMVQVFDWMRDTQGIGNLRWFENHAAMLEFAKKFEQIYIYGAGYYGKRCAALLERTQVRIENFLVSWQDGNEMIVEGIPVAVFTEVELKSDSGIIVAVKADARDAICQLIKQKMPEFTNIFLFG